MTNTPSPATREIETTLHPSRAYAHPNDVVNDPDLTTFEKRAILSAWASDACAVESCPSARRFPGAKAAVTFDEVLDALKRLDDEPPPSPGGSTMRLHYRRDGPDAGFTGSL